MTTLTVPGQLENVPHVRRWLEGVLSENGVSPDTTSDLALAATEVCTNIVRHGYGERSNGDIELELSISGAEIRLTIVDTAPPFSPDQFTPPVPGEARMGGYGLYLIHSLMDEVSHQNMGRNGNRTVLTKYEKASSEGY